MNNTKDITKNEINQIDNDVQEDIVNEIKDNMNDMTKDEIKQIDNEFKENSLN